jgi:hypothetical protein
VHVTICLVHKAKESDTKLKLKAITALPLKAGQRRKLERYSGNNMKVTQNDFHLCLVLY